MKNNSETTPHTAGELLSDLRALVSEAEKMMGDSISENTAEAVQALRIRFEAAQERLGVVYAGAKQKVVAGARCTDEAVRTHPYQSITIAAGVGVLVGVLLGRRGK